MIEQYLPLELHLQWKEKNGSALTIIGDIFAVLGVAIRIIDWILKKRREKAFEKLKQQGLLIAIDDLRDLGANPHILSQLYDENLRY